MRSSSCQLAIETSGRSGSIALGRGDTLLSAVTLPPPKRHRVELMPTIDTLCRTHDVKPKDLASVGVSIGPGSFTGLRIAVATAKMLAMTTGTKAIACPTADIIAAESDPDVAKHVAVLLSVKQGTAWCSLYQYEGERWALQRPAGLESISAFLASAPRPIMVAAGMTLDDEVTGEGVIALPTERVEPSAETLWQLMQSGLYEPTDPMKLLPLYARVPEAQEQWDRRYGASATIQTRTAASS